jgi:hypothetical protein
MLQPKNDGGWGKAMTILANHVKKGYCYGHDIPFRQDSGLAFQNCHFEPKARNLSGQMEATVLACGCRTLRPNYP